jgi:hypothetical protein
MKRNSSHNSVSASRCTRAASAGGRGRRCLLGFGGSVAGTGLLATDEEEDMSESVCHKSAQCVYTLAARVLTSAVVLSHLGRRAPIATRTFAQDDRDDGLARHGRAHGATCDSSGGGRSRVMVR